MSLELAAPSSTILAIVVPNIVVFAAVAALVQRATQIDKQLSTPYGRHEIRS